MIRNVMMFCIAINYAIVLPAQKSNWQNLDLKNDSFFGISTEKAYMELLKDKKSVPVIVAIIDSGIDTAHEDLRTVLWTSPEDGSHGRSYTGYETGKEDITMLANAKKDFYDSLSYARVPDVYRVEYKTYRMLSDDYQAHIGNLNLFISKLKESKKILDQILKNIGKEKPALQDFKQYETKDEEEQNIIKLVVDKLPQYKSFEQLKFYELDNLINFGQYHLEHGLNINRTKSAKTTIANTDVNTDALGLVENPNITPNHGTHVSGIVAAVRNNGKGIDGIADNVRIMMLKVVNNIREMRDTDLANAIRFAVDNGAKVINMSLGKVYTFNKKAVDEAVKYAMDKDVLIIHGAGNSGLNLDSINSIFYPIRQYEKGGTATAWLNVAASGFTDDATLVPSFSNYGSKTVDVFAPGVQIYSSIPYSQYAAWSGTSMAAPVVSGLAALIREYYPKLTAVQVKDIIMKSVVKRDVLRDKCVSGGVVNAYNALRLASTYK